MIGLVSDMNVYCLYMPAPSHFRKIRNRPVLADKSRPILVDEPIFVAGVPLS